LLKIYAAYAEPVNSGVKSQAQTARALHDSADRLLKYAVKDAFGSDASKLETEKGSRGKPYFKNSEIYFNISHADDLAVVAVSDSEVGIDTEKCDRIIPDKVFSRFAAGLFSEISDPVLRWTLIESYAKYTGQGIPIDTVHDANIYFHSYRSIAGYILTVCSAKDDFPSNPEIVSI